MCDYRGHLFTIDIVCFVFTCQGDCFFAQVKLCCWQHAVQRSEISLVKWDLTLIYEITCLQVPFSPKLFQMRWFSEEVLLVYFSLLAHIVYACFVHTVCFFITIIKKSIIFCFLLEITSHYFECNGALTWIWSVKHISHMLCHSLVWVSNKSCDFIVQCLLCPYFIMLTLE